MSEGELFFLLGLTAYSEGLICGSHLDKLTFQFTAHLVSGSTPMLGKVQAVTLPLCQWRMPESGNLADLRVCSYSVRLTDNCYKQDVDFFHQ